MTAAEDERRRQSYQQQRYLDGLEAARIALGAGEDVGFDDTVDQEGLVSRAEAFLLNLIAAVPYKIHTVLTDNGAQFTTPGAGGSAVPMIKEAIAQGELFRGHAFEMACARNDIEHRTTKAKHPWTNGQVERTIKDATVKRYYYESHEQLRRHLGDFVCAYNFGRRLKTLKGLPPYEFICKRWTTEPQRLMLAPLKQMPGLNI